MALDVRPMASFHDSLPQLFPALSQIEANHSPLHASDIGLLIFTQLNFDTLMNARQVCRNWYQLIEEHQYSYYNQKLMDPLEIRQKKAWYLDQPVEKLEKDQQSLLKVVKLSRLYKHVNVAAANALMLLKATGFRFTNADFQGIQVPDVRLSRSLLDGANFTGANLKGADLTDCSLNGTCFNEANLEDVKFGQLPYLEHTGDLITMALAPNGKHLASIDNKCLYLWDLETSEIKQIVNDPIKPKLFGTFESNSFLLFSHDSRLLFRAHSQGKIEVWTCDPLAKIFHLSLEHVLYFSSFVLTDDGRYLISVANTATYGKKLSTENEIATWQINDSNPEVPLLELVSKRSINTKEKLKFSLASQTLAAALSSPNCIELYSIPSLEKVKSFPLNEKESIEQLLFTPDAHLLLIAKRETKDLTVSTMPIQGSEEGRLSLPLFIEEEIKEWQFLPGSGYLAYTAQEGSFCIRDVRNYSKIHTRQKLESLTMHLEQQLWFNKKQLYQLVENKILIMPLEKFKLRNEIPIHASLQTACFSTNGRTFYTLDWQNKIYACQSAKHKFFYNTKLPEIAFSKSILKAAKLPPGFLANRLMQSFGAKNVDNSLNLELTLKRIDLILSSLSQEQKEHGNIKPKILASTLSQNDNYWVIADQEGLKLWDVTTQQRLGFLALPFQTTSMHLVLAPSTSLPNFLLTIDQESKEQPVTAWEIDWERQLAQQVDEFLQIEDVRFLDHSRLILRRRNEMILWDIQKNEKEVITFDYHLGSFDVTQDGSLMVTTETLDQHPYTQIILWDLQQKRILDQQMLPFASLPSRMFSFPPRSIYISPQGQYVIGWEMSSTLKKMYVWEIREGQLLFLWKIPQQLEARNLQVKNAKNLSSKNAQLLTQLQNILKDLPCPPNFYKKVGDLQQLLGRYTEAQIWYEKALESQGNSYQLPKTYSKLGSLKQLLGKYTEAQEWYEKALATQKSFGQQSKIYTRLGSLKHVLGEYTEAQMCYDKALKIQTKNYHLADLYSRLGSLQQSLGEYTEAQEWYKKALEIQENHYSTNHLDSNKIHNQWRNILQILKETSATRELQTENFLSRPHPLQNVYNILERLNQTSKSEEYYKKINEIKNLCQSILVLDLSHNLTEKLDGLWQSLKHLQDLIGLTHSICKVEELYRSILTLVHNLSEMKKLCQSILDARNPSEIEELYQSILDLDLEHNLTEVEELCQSILDLEHSSNEEDSDIEDLSSRHSLIPSSSEEGSDIEDLFLTDNLCEVEELCQSILSLIHDLKGVEQLHRSILDLNLAQNPLKNGAASTKPTQKTQKYLEKRSAKQEKNELAWLRALADTYAKFASLMQELGKVDEAQKLLKQAINIQKEVYPPEHPIIAEICIRVGSVLQELKEFKQAKHLYKIALKLLKVSCLEDHPVTSALYNYLGNVYQDLEEHLKAKKNYQEALARLKRLYPKDHPSMLPVYINLGNIRQELGQYVKAEKDYQTALMCLKKFFPNGHPAIADVYNNLGNVYQELGYVELAKACLKSVLKYAQEDSDYNQPLLADAYNNIGVMYKVLRKFKKAKKYLKESLQLKQRIYGENHPSLAESYNNLGNVLQQLGKYEQAKAYYEQALCSPNLSSKLKTNIHDNLAKALENLKKLTISPNFYDS